MPYLLHHLFLSTALSKPNNTAIICENGELISYRNLNLLANKFANVFNRIKNDIRGNPYVGIISPVHIQSIAAILGVLKIGCAYVPLDEYSPTERLGHIINSTSLDVIVIDSNLYQKYCKLFSKTQIKKFIIIGDPISINVEDEKQIPPNSIIQEDDGEPKSIEQVSDDLAYILHSSGSTGIPKGIMLTHRNAITFVSWMQKEFKLTQHDKIMSRAPFKFDLSVFDIFNTFNVGATLICFDWNKKRVEDEQHIEYVKLMEREGATILYTTPSTYICLMNRGNLKETKLKLREIMYAGEPFPIPQLRRLMTLFPNTKIANIYGPTETNIITYYWINNLPNDDSSIPLGKAVDDTEIIIASEDNKRICDPNEIGEIWCRGGTVTMGYLGTPEKTKEQLIKSPFHGYPAYFWRTGDYGYRDENDCLYYKGRKDHMVKVKGYRIEIGEVEAAIAQVPYIDEFVVVAVPDEKYTNRLSCYYSTRHDQFVSEENMRTFLLTKLPEYMIPYKFTNLHTLPKTSSGKVDRNLLSHQPTQE
jgi:amino acid adenylation domain-containing protein